MNIRFEVLDQHPGCGRRKKIVETFDHDCKEELGRYCFPEAGKIYSELFRKWNGKVNFLKQDPRYQVRYYLMNEKK